MYQQVFEAWVAGICYKKMIAAIRTLVTTKFSTMRKMQMNKQLSTILPTKTSINFLEFSITIKAIFVQKTTRSSAIGDLTFGQLCKT